MLNIVILKLTHKEVGIIIFKKSKYKYCTLGLHKRHNYNKLYNTYLFGSQKYKRKKLPIKMVYDYNRLILIVKPLFQELPLVQI